MLCGTKPFIFKMHGKLYINDYEGMLLKKLEIICFNLEIHKCILNVLLMLKNT
jgi:hypothetical protein